MKGLELKHEQVGGPREYICYVVWSLETNIFGYGSQKKPLADQRFWSIFPLTYPFSVAIKTHPWSTALVFNGGLPMAMADTTVKLLWEVLPEPEA